MPGQKGLHLRPVNPLADDAAAVTQDYGCFQLCGHAASVAVEVVSNGSRTTRHSFWNYSDNCH